MYTVQSEIPLPRRHIVLADRVRKYPFREMEVGDMFFVPRGKSKALASHASDYGKKLAAKFSTRQVVMRRVGDAWEPCELDDPGATTGVGVWRIK